jgi:DNA repair protein RadC
MDRQASGINLIHNHPSGSLKTNQLDISLTKRLSEVGRLSHIQIFDHLIIGDTGYYSFGDEACCDCGILIM